MNLNCTNELLKEEAAQNKDITANLTNSLKTVDAKVGDVDKKLLGVVSNIKAELNSKIQDSLALAEVSELVSHRELILIQFSYFSRKLRNPWNI